METDRHHSLKIAMTCRLVESSLVQLKPGAAGRVEGMNNEY